ncbi:alanine--tRNA ligase [Streptomyces sp. ISL-11]|uniref:alanine--tRNA ligase n=1 Tax=Streptomyces sp. ISL-11 TaxID=2819174 RepID=UPI001BE7FD6C|nr:alanine--tRNA ligase [Streptomyces sp. ISL-11]MBT2386808.1 alanine--tRNA ligase [Streptomyces sp. ISL-11]
MRTADIRSRFLDFFAARGHTVVPSAPLPTPDPTLLFVNAGMVPFKPYLTGEAAPPWPRATSVQKCVRTLDIEEVGRTTRHGSFFQMNGNFSFGDYFKEEAVSYAWQLSTSPVAEGGYGLDPDRIWATVRHSDDEAAELWRRIGLPPERVVRRGDEDNFWSMGVPGPCGPCSELYYDRGPALGRAGGPAVDEDRYMEFWNLVFMQYERGEGGGKTGYPILGELPRRNIDTGMGLERMATLLQGVDNLYEIDETRPVLDRAAELTGVRYGADHQADVRLRVVADHVRTALMLLADGTAPGNEGRGYVLRRILRRAVRSVRLLGYQDPALPELLPAARDRMAHSYPEVAGEFDRIAQQAYAEEDAFRSTLRQGTTVLDTAVAEVRKQGGHLLPGKQAFLLHDTYGFPIDLTLEMAEEQGVEVDRDGFTALMAEQRERARADARARKSGGALDTSALRSVLDAHGPTDWRAYDTLLTDSTVLALLGPAGPLTSVRAGEIATVVLDRTPFYAESGGQESDAGVLTGASVEAEVLDVQRPLPGLVAHQVRVTAGELAVGDAVRAAVDAEWRLGARQAHSGTHVLHAALRQVLGPTALQAGSYNRPGYLRLDFPWRGALGPAARGEVEEAANRALRRDLPVDARWMTLPEAKELGALALFGETYGERVRVVEIGGAWSRELCGGTHVAHASQIGLVALTGESSVGAGMRRLEAAVGVEGFGYLARERDLVARLAEQLQAPRARLADRVAVLLDRLKAADQAAEELRQRATLGRAAELAAAATDVDGTVTVTATTDGDARSLALAVRDRLPEARPGVAVIGAEAGGRAVVTIALNTAARAAGLSAATLVKSLLGGRGGGTADVAQGGGIAAESLPATLDAVRGLLAGG